MKKSRTKPGLEAAALGHDMGATASTKDLDYFIELFFCERSDEAAAHIAEFLLQVALCFENTHLSQIRRYHQSMRPPPDYDPRQFELFDPF